MYHQLVGVPMRYLALVAALSMIISSIALGQQSSKPTKGTAKVKDASTSNTVAMETSKGTIVLELYPDKAPITVKNFFSYVDEKFFDSTIFHRVIDGFMIQGGGFTADMNQKKTHAPIQIESKNGLTNKRGTIAMARTNDPNSATSQFFINVADNAMLDYPKPDGNGYTVFGKVIEGMDVVDKIKTVTTGNKGMHQNVPIEPVTILSVRRVNQPAEKNK
jgi:peptidyl-prolyl cis-trans isomerase A (cyclophilin A)